MATEFVKLLRTTAGPSPDNTTFGTASPTGKRRKLLMACVAYSAVPTHAGVTVTLDSGAGADFDTELFVGLANLQYDVYIPNNDVVIETDDSISVTAPAGGAGVTSAISIYTANVE